jgi:CubicO group peptidase (beta-lactamase class C family)
MPEVPVNVRGSVAPGFEEVARVFGANLELDGELGASYAVYRDGKPVVDIWGGIADPRGGGAWERDTLQLIFSGSKALVAVCLLILVDRGELDPEAPVAEYWPEFAAAGKGQVKVIECASHRARLPGLRVPVSEDELTDDRRMAALLAAQPQEEDPRAADSYHPLTYGWLCGELIRRIDGRSVGRFFADEVARPLDLDIWIGLPSEREEAVSQLAYAPTWGLETQLNPEEISADELLARVWDNPALFPVGRMPWNRPDWHAAEIPGAGAIGSARSLAKLCSCLASDGELDGVRLLCPEALSFGRQELSRRQDPLIDDPMTFGFGLQLQTDRKHFGPPDDAFGHAGAGGSVHCAWPSERVGISFAMNTMRDDQPVDRRTEPLLRATHEALTGPDRRPSRLSPT